MAVGHRMDEDGGAVFRRRLRGGQGRAVVTDPRKRRVAGCLKDAWGHHGLRCAWLAHGRMGRRISAALHEVLLHESRCTFPFAG